MDIAPKPKPPNTPTQATFQPAIDNTNIELALMHYKKALIWFKAMDDLRNDPDFWNDSNGRPRILQDAASMRFLAAVAHLNKGVGWEIEGESKEEKSQRKISTFRTIDKDTLFKEVSGAMGDAGQQIGRYVWANDFKDYRNDIAHDYTDKGGYSGLKDKLYNNRQYDAMRKALPIAIQELSAELQSASRENMALLVARVEAGYGNSTYLNHPMDNGRMRRY